MCFKITQQKEKELNACIKQAWPYVDNYRNWAGIHVDIKRLNYSLYFCACQYFNKIFKRTMYEKNQHIYSHFSNGRNR